METRTRPATAATPVATFKFTASVVMAIEAMIQLFSVNGLHKRLAGAKKPEDFTRLPRPEFDLTFFHQIRVSPIWRKERVELSKDRVGHWRVDRIVEFEFEGVVIANIWLSGMKLDREKGNRDNNSSWAISRIRYAMRLEPDAEHGRVAKDWKDFMFEVSSFTSRYMA